MESVSSFAERLREAMTLRQMKQADLCRATGIPKSAMSQYLSGAFLPKQDRLWALAHALQVNEAWLMGYDHIPMERKPYGTAGSGALREVNENVVKSLEPSSQDIQESLPDIYLRLAQGAQKMELSERDIKTLLDIAKTLKERDEQDE